MHAFRFFCIERCLFRVFCTERSMPRHTNSDKHVLLKRQPSLNVHCHVPITLSSCALPHQIIQVSLIFGSPVDRLHTIGYTASSHCSYFFFIMCILCLIDLLLGVVPDLVKSPNTPIQWVLYSAIWISIIPSLPTPPIFITQTNHFRSRRLLLTKTYCREFFRIGLCPYRRWPPPKVFVVCFTLDVAGLRFSKLPSI